MSKPYIREGRLYGVAEVYLGNAFIQLSRCWLDVEESKFFVEDSAEGMSKAKGENFAFRNIKFRSQIGELLVDEILPSYASSVPSFGGFDNRSSLPALMFEFVFVAPVWRFVCNDPIQLKCEITDNEVYFRPGKYFEEITLCCGATLSGSEFGIRVTYHSVFSDEHQTALELAVGAPLREFSRAFDGVISINLNNWPEVNNSSFRDFSDVSNGNWVDRKKQKDAVSEIYRASLEFQRSHDDGGKGFRFAVGAFLESRSFRLGYTLKMLSVMHMLEWLDGETTINAKALEIKFSIPSRAAKAIMILRNEVSHNHHSVDKGTDLSTCVSKAAKDIASAGMDLQGMGFGSLDVGLLNYLYSLVGKLLLERLGAKVTPANFLPGFGEFKY